MVFCFSAWVSVPTMAGLVSCLVGEVVGRKRVFARAVLWREVRAVASAVFVGVVGVRPKRPSTASAQDEGADAETRGQVGLA